MKRTEQGFTLVELVTVVTIMAILVTVAYPSFGSYIRKATRTEAQSTLMDWSIRQVNWRADHGSYNSDLQPSDSEYYAYSMTSTSTSFTLTATAKGTQTADEERGISCSTLTVTQLGTVGPEGCWSR